MENQLRGLFSGGLVASRQSQVGSSDGVKIKSENLQQISAIYIMSRCVLFFPCSFIYSNKRLHACIDKHKQVVHSLSACNYNDTVRRYSIYIPWLSTTILSIWFTYIHPCMLVHHANIIQYLKPPASRKRSHVDWPKHVPNIHRGTATSQPRLHSGVRHRMGSGGTFPMASGKSTSKASVEDSVEGWMWLCTLDIQLELCQLCTLSGGFQFQCC